MMSDGISLLPLLSEIENHNQIKGRNVSYISEML